MSKFIRLLSYVLLLACFAFALVYRFVERDKSLNANPVTFPEIYAKDGRPVAVHKVVKGNLAKFHKVSVVRKGKAAVAYVGKSKAKDIRAGMGVYTPDLKNRIGQVRGVANSVSIDSGMYNIDITILESNKDAVHSNLIPLAVHYQTVKEALIVPVNALSPNENGIFVWKVDGSKAKKVQVEFKDYNQANVAVLKGLDEGDDVIISGNRSLDETMKINVKR